MKTYEAIARAFLAEGVKDVFALVGDANLQWSVAMHELGASVHGLRNESGVVAAADGYARSGGGVGVGSVTSGPGLVESGTALASAVRSGAPLVLFVGDTPAVSPGNPQNFDHRRYVEACGAEFVPLRGAASALDDVRLAFYRARAGRCAVVLNAPTDIQAADHAGEWTYMPTPADLGRARTEAATDARARVMELIASCERPVIVAGRGAMESGDPSELIALADRIGAVLATTLPAKGWLDEDPYALGVIGPNQSQVAGEILAGADLVLAFGASLDRFAVQGRTPVFPEATVVSINTQPAAPGENRPADLYVAGDAVLVARQLVADASERGIERQGLRTKEVEEQLADAAPQPVASEPGRLDPREVMQVLERHLTATGHRIVVGCGHFYSWPITHLRRPRGGNFTFTDAFASIGLALATGIGAAVAHPEQTVVVVEGDGSLMTNLGELEAAARLGLRLLVVVVNDETLGAEYYKARTFGLDPALTRMPAPRFDEVARALGAAGALVTDGASLDAALTDFEARGGVYVLDARVDGEIMCDMYRNLHFGLPNIAPHQREDV